MIERGERYAGEVTNVSLASRLGDRVCRAVSVIEVHKYSGWGLMYSGKRSADARRAASNNQRRHYSYSTDGQSDVAIDIEGERAI